MTVTPFGDRAVRFAITPGTRRAGLLARLRAIPEVVDVVLAESIGMVVTADAPTAGLGEAIAQADADAIAQADADANANANANARAHEVRVVYDGEDLASLAAALSLSVDELVSIHTAPAYEVVMLGFLPGFAYMRGLDPRLVVPRRGSPRARVPRNCVAIAADYTGIYPSASPGGWHLLGEALDHHPFGPEGALFAPGDRVRFVAVAASRRHGSAVAAAAASEPPSGPHLEVLRAQGPSIVVDAGRFGHMHEGVPHSGPLIRSAFTSANVWAGNVPSAAAIEIQGRLEIAARGGRIVIASDTTGPLTLEPNESLAITTDASSRARYLAIAGGISVPSVLGSRTTLLASALGGHHGRPLQRGTILSPSRSPSSSFSGSPSPSPSRSPSSSPSLSFLPTADASPSLLTAISRTTFRISPTSDRTGTRLTSDSPLTSVHTARTESTPMTLGAIELTPSGLVVLGPDHPTTGGYPVVGVLLLESLDRFFERPLGANVRLRNHAEKVT